MKVLEENSKVEVSPYLSALQLLKGKAASDKYKELHSIAAEVLKNAEEKKKFLQTGITDRVPAVLCPTLQILVGMRLKSNEAVINALKSSDSSITKQGLKAKWFFKASNCFIDINYMMKELLPFISLQTRLELIKKLGKCLKAEPEKANAFFQQFVELYGVNQTLPILFACSEDFIYQEILKHKINLSFKMLRVLYNKHPQLAVRYLQLGNETNESNVEDRLVHKINLARYSGFFASLVKNHTQEFVEFYSYFPEILLHYATKLGTTRTKLFLKKARDALIEKPRSFLPLLSLKVVTEKLSDEQFGAMFKNLLPQKLEAHQFAELVNYLKHQPQDKAYELLSKSYQAVYGDELLKYKGILDHIVVTDLIPLDLKIEIFKEHVKANPDTEAFMQIKDLLPLMKEKIDKATADHLKSLYASHLIYSCRLYNDKKDLLEVFNYFYNHLMNESAEVLQSFLERLYVLIDLSTLEKEHWQVLLKIVQQAYITGNLFVKVKTDSDLDKFELETIMTKFLLYFLKQCQREDADESDRQLLDMFVNVALEYFFEHNIKMPSVPESLELQKDCISKFLQAVPSKYPGNHAVWKDLANKLKLTRYLIKSMVQYNRNTKEEAKLSIQDYPWLKQFATDLIKGNHKMSSKLLQSYVSFKTFLRIHDLVFYRSIVDSDASLIYDVTTDDALLILKKDPKKIMDKWELYLTACKENLLTGSKATRRFVAATRWYAEIPLKFVEECVKEIDNKENLLVLAILLEGDAFGKIIQPFLPKEKEVNGAVEEAKKSYKMISDLANPLKFTNPPVSLDVLAPLCQDRYSSQALPVFSNVVEKIPVNQVSSFANKLMDKSESMKDLAVRLMFQVAPKSELCKLLSQIFEGRKCLKDEKGMAKMVFDLFTQTPCEETWHLMKSFIKLLSSEVDKNVFRILQNIDCVNSKYVSDYIVELIEKMSELKEYQKEDIISPFVDQLKTSKANLSENALSFIIKECFFELPHDFIFDKYLFSDPEKFESRLELVIEVLTGTEISEPHAKKTKLEPANQRINKFFSNTKLFDHLANEDKKSFLMQFPTTDKQEMKLRFFNRVLEIPSIKEDLLLYVNLNIYKIYFEESDPKKFGEKCGKNVKDLTAILNQEYLYNHYGDTMRHLVHRNYNNLQPMKLNGKELDVIEGLKSCDLNVSVAIGVKLLSATNLRDYDERYDDFINVAQKHCDALSRTALNNFLSTAEKFKSLEYNVS